MKDQFKKFNSDLSNWNVINIKNISHTFYCFTNFNWDLSQWNVVNVTDMFDNAINFNSDLSNW